jgi:hypothetical protein
MKAIQCIEIFNLAIADFHVTEHVDALLNNPYERNTIESLFYSKCWIDTVQWHLEDIIRDPEIEPSKGMSIKRRIDASNQDRTDMVEKLDDYYISVFKDNQAQQHSTINTESPGWVVDRISILCLKIWHMKEQVERINSSESHKITCQAKLDILKIQKEDLISSFDLLLDDYKKGLKSIKVYRQMKMYNDEELNPVLYKKSNS